MGRNKIDFEKNRCKKIERNKIKRKNKTYNPFRNIIAPTKKKKIQNKVLNILNTNKFYAKPVKIKDKVIISIPKSFCFIENANETINILKQINSAIFNWKIQKIYFDYLNCEMLGLDASLVTDIIVLNGLELRKKIGFKIGFSEIILNPNQPLKYF